MSAGDDGFDFSQGERGRFYRPRAEHQVPVYFDRGVLDQLTEKANELDVTPSELASRMLRKDFELHQ